MVFAGFCRAQTTKAQLETSETLFSLFSALNGCGYDDGLNNSMPVRQAVRTEIIGAVRRSPEAAQSLQAVCQFQKEHMAAEPSRDIVQYVSLGLELGPPPDFKPTLNEADLPPDAAHVLGVTTLLQKFYQLAGLHSIWQKHRGDYESLIQRFHEPISASLTQTDLYLKLAFSTYLGRRFVIYLEPLLAPAQINSRNYGDDYFLVLSPSQEGSLHLPEVRHTYLHYILEPLALKHGASFRRLDPLLQNVQAAPMDESFRHDIALLVNECLIRAIEARMLPAGKANEEARTEYVERSVQEGFVLTHYFYEALANFEKGPTGIKDAYGDLLYNINLEDEKKRASHVEFASQAAPELVHASRPAVHEAKYLDDAEQRLASNDPAGAQKLAMQALNDPRSNEDQGRAFFILARAAILSRDEAGARNYFEQAVQAAHDPRMLAWSHIYLGRIFDLEDKRDQAVAHYHAALQAGDPTPDTKAAAEKGLAAPYHTQPLPQH